MVIFVLKKKNKKKRTKHANGAPLNLIVISEIHNEIIKYNLNLMSFVGPKYRSSTSKKKIIKVIMFITKSGDGEDSR